jgi:hypothetical protein
MEFYLLALLFVAIAFVAIGINVFFRKGAKFPETDVGRNRKMKEIGITCPRCEEMNTWQKMSNREKKEIKPAELRIDLDNIR